ncbi:MAG: substrate-binding domain-containing protein [Treponema sp.]|jgi:ribose transport system substrate-binding protein|nr:substrate-binding domain-containing protein [Treponema sp.]
MCRKEQTIVWLLAAAVLLTVGFFGCNRVKNAEPDRGGKYKIALSNSYMGNDWRQNMIRVTELAMSKSPYKEKVDLTIVNTENSPEAQSASIDAMIKQGYDAIVIDCASPRGLNPVIDRAVNAGITVVTFDQIADNQNCYGIESDWAYLSEIIGKFMVEVLSGRGNVVMDRGLPGAPVSAMFYDGVMKVFKQYPNIKVVAEFDGMYSEGPSEQGVAAAITANSQIDAVFTQGYVNSIVRAFKNANRPIPCITGNNYQSTVRAAIEDRFPVLMYSADLVGFGAMAIQVAIDILEGNPPPEKHMVIKDAIFYSLTTEVGDKIGVTIKNIEDVYFPDVPPSFMWPVLPDDFPVQITKDELLQ